MFKMLVVDDENLIRYSLTRTFQGTNISVRTAETGGEALQAIQEERFDICFLDLHLPDMSGVEVLRTLSWVAPETKIIVMSGDRMEEQTVDMVRKHAVVFIEKPFDLDYAKYITSLIIRWFDSASSDVRLPDGHLPAARERRRCLRHESNKVIMCSAMASAGDAKAVAIEAALKDISDAGMGFVTAQPVEPGWVLTVFDGEIINQGVVRWTAVTHPPGTYKVGMQYGVH